MPRKKLIVRIMERIDKELEEDERGVFIILYDFKNRSYMPKEFYYALKELEENGHYVDRIQKSAYLTNSLRTARIIIELAKHYGAEVRAFEVSKEV